RSRRRALRTHRFVARIVSRWRMGRVIYGAPHLLPAGAAGAVSKAIRAVEIPHHVGPARRERKVVARCGQDDPRRWPAARNQSRRVAAVVERTSRGYQPGGSEAAADGVSAPLLAPAGAQT